MERLDVGYVEHRLKSFYNIGVDSFLKRNLVYGFMLSLQRYTTLFGSNFD